MTFWVFVDFACLVLWLSREVSGGNISFGMSSHELIGAKSGRCVIRPYLTS